MPDIGAHQQQVEHNRQTTVYLQQAGENYLDWAVTVLFYTALHLVDQVLYTLELSTFDLVLSK